MALRRDRVLLPSLVAVFVVVAASSGGATRGLYPTAGSQATAAEGVNAAPALVALYGAGGHGPAPGALYGPVYDVTSLGALAFFKLIVLGAALVALLASLLVIRHTRADEEL